MRLTETNNRNWILETAWLSLTETDWNWLGENDWLRMTDWDWLRLFDRNWLTETDWLRLTAWDWLTKSDWLRLTNWDRLTENDWDVLPDTHWLGLIATDWDLLGLTEIDFTAQAYMYATWKIDFCLQEGGGKGGEGLNLLQQSYMIRGYIYDQSHGLAERSTRSAGYFAGMNMNIKRFELSFTCFGLVANTIYTIRMGCF